MLISIDFCQVPWSRRMKQALDLLHQVRDELGDDCDVCLEIHRGLTPAQAIPLLSEMASLRPFFVEDPIRPDAIAAMAGVQNAVAVPIALLGAGSIPGAIEGRWCVLHPPEPESLWGLYGCPAYRSPCQGLRCPDRATQYVLRRRHNDGGPFLHRHLECSPHGVSDTSLHGPAVTGWRDAHWHRVDHDVAHACAWATEHRWKAGPWSSAGRLRQRPVSLSSGYYVR